MKSLTASPPERRLLPGGGVRGPVPLLIAIMMFVMIIVSATALALGNMAALVRTGVENRYSIQIADGAAKQHIAVAAARRAPGVVDVSPVPQEELRRTLERWLGPAAADADLPLPAMIDVDLAPGANVDAVRSIVERAVPSARLTAQGDSLAPLLAALRGSIALAVGLVVLIALATGAAVVLAARGALNTHRATIEVMHGIGATDQQIARLFQRQIAVDSLMGGVAGATLAGVVLLLALGGGALDTLLGGTRPLGWSDALLLAVFPLIGAALATLVARRAVLGALRARL
ncbi:hypothetical protein SH584_07725 [Sphingomonas sp. LY29]|uniref:cell division protein FtsX n=1 Tax=Sphingomonas sp. LY29 TaxID=3095341 RepID=UPI002D799BD2|nr:hypothetical protein [Sphingomonas sp. LY29]WRP24948.1 hypothetical protein SH584_07725 [Sphingomonas sp. LY29]